MSRLKYLQEEMRELQLSVRRAIKDSRRWCLPEDYDLLRKKPETMNVAELEQDIAELKDELGDILQENNGEELYFVEFDAWEWGEKQSVSPPPVRKQPAVPPPRKTDGRKFVFNHPIKELIWLLGTPTNS